MDELTFQQRMISGFVISLMVFPITIPLVLGTAAASGFVFYKSLKSSTGKAALYLSGIGAGICSILFYAWWCYHISFTKLTW